MTEKKSDQRAVPIITESDHRHFAVAITFVDEVNLLFQVRSDKLPDQPGDICFPGGAVEAGEKPEDAVIRELSEKLLIGEEQVNLQEECFRVVNDLSIIHCFPCRITGYTGSFSEEEVAEVFTVPITFFKHNPPKTYEVNWSPVFPEDFPFDKIHGGRNYGWRPRKSRIRFYEYGGRVIWGLTAKMIESYVK